ncbi:uncharacterized protein BX663DRAFT_500737 [Cokeromyces recurvatus]|uniref:uncharacterized protein n=1 Tax=Cokeromyces recurvatus TaxID=90255 RepID=UPI0022203707|nr:uncharacterized protein BX663DRAFT_500737 [Cokeromyces recurvatus]KAI7905737.1 hypothetical protein BX663DRAFT_500737 [Cokeromyces recurvatus]
MMDTFPSINFIIFNKLAKKKATHYILDFVTREFESIISCYPSSIEVTHISMIPYKKNKYQHSKNGSNFDHSGLPSPPSSSPLRKKSYITLPPSPPLPTQHTNTTKAPMSLREYIEYVMERSHLDTGTLLTSLCYARRLKTKLFHTSKGMGCTHHRIFLATLIIASKYIHDSAIKNKYWIEYALNLFSGAEINLMEKQLLQLLEYKLEIAQSEFEDITSDIADLYLEQQTEDNHSSPFDYWYQHYYYAHKQQDSAYESSSSSSLSSPIIKL